MAAKQIRGTIDSVPERFTFAKASCIIPACRTEGRVAKYAIFCNGSDTWDSYPDIYCEECYEICVHDKEAWPPTPVSDVAVIDGIFCVRHEGEWMGEFERGEILYPPTPEEEVEP